MKDERGAVRAMVLEVLPDNKRRVELADGTLMIGYLAGKIRFNRIDIAIGDTVLILPDKHGGKTTNRIIRRL